MVKMKRENERHYTENKRHYTEHYTENKRHYTKHSTENKRGVKQKLWWYLFLFGQN